MTDRLIRVAGVAVAVWGALLLSVYGVFLTPLRVGTVLVPVALVIAVGGNALLIRFAYRVSGHRLVALLPGLIWIVVTFASSARTTEGDLLLYQSNWVAVLYLFAGSAAVAVAGYRLMTRPAPSPADHDP